jgi:hypothetical protein
MVNPALGSLRRGTENRYFYNVIKSGGVTKTQFLPGSRTGGFYAHRWHYDGQLGVTEGEWRVRLHSDQLPAD